MLTSLKIRSTENILSAGEKFHSAKLLIMLELKIEYAWY
jgi:hypothetical protein